MEPRKLHIPRGEQIFGEFSAADIEASVNEGRFIGTDMYWNESTNEWLPLANLITMQTQTAPAPASQRVTATPHKSKSTPFPWVSIAVIALICLGIGGYFLMPKRAKNVVIPKDMTRWDTTVAPALQKLNEEDRRLATGYILRAKLGEAFGSKETIPDGMTIQKAIDEQRKFEEKEAKEEADSKALAAKVKAAKEAVAAEIAKTLTVAFVDKGVSKRDFSENITADFAYENKGTKDIAGFKGVAEFYNMFGDKIYSVNLFYEDGLAVGKSVTWKGSMHYNNFMDQEPKFKDTPIDKMSFKFVPEAIVFADGTRLSAKDAE